MNLKIRLTIWLTTFALALMALNISAKGQTETLIVHSKHLKKELSLTITLPESYEQNKDKYYPVIFDLHPRAQPYMSGMQDWLSHNAERPWLETIIVTPTKDIVVKSADSTGFGELLENTIATPTDKKLLQLLDEDMLAAIDKHYRTNSYRIYNGFMRNGAVGLYILLNQPNMFNAYLIASPTLANDFLNISSDSESKLPRLTDRIRTLYISAGNHRFEQSNTSAVQDFTASLKKIAPKQLEWQAKLDDNSHYMSRPINNLAAGIELAFKDAHSNLAPDSEISKQGVDAIIEYYEMLSTNKYGFNVSAERSLLSFAAQQANTSPVQAISILTKTVAMYPQSPFAFNALAAAYVEMKDYENAIKYQKSAIANSSSLFQRQKDYLQNKLAEYEKIANR